MTGTRTRTSLTVALGVGVLALSGSTGASGAAPVYHQPTPLAVNQSISERDISFGAGWFRAWTANSTKRPHDFDVILFETDSGVRWRVNAPRSSGASGNFRGDTLVYSQHRPGKPSDIFRIHAPDMEHRVRYPAPVNTAADEVDPTISGPWLLFTRHTARTGQDRILLYNRKTEEIRRLALAKGSASVEAGQVNGDYATWHRSGPDKANVFRHQISTGTTVRVPRPGRDHVRQYNPAVMKDGTLFFVRRPGGERGFARLMRYAEGGPAQVWYRFLRGTVGGSNIAANDRLYFTMTFTNAPRTRSDDTYFLPDQPPE